MSQTTKKTGVVFQTCNCSMTPAKKYQLNLYGSVVHNITKAGKYRCTICSKT